MRAWRGVAAAAAVLTAACGSTGDTATKADDPPGTRYRVNATVLQAPGRGAELCFTVADSYPPQCGGPPITNWDWAEAPHRESANGVTWGQYNVVGTYDGERFTLTQRPGSPIPPPRAIEPGQFDPACDNPSVVKQASESNGLGDLGDLQQHVVAVWVSEPASGDWKGPYTLSYLVRPGHAKAVEERVRASYQGHLCVVERDGPTLAELQQISTELNDTDKELPGKLGWGPDGKGGYVRVEMILATEAARDYARKRWGDKVKLESALKPA